MAILLLGVWPSAWIAALQVGCTNAASAVQEATKSTPFPPTRACLFIYYNKQERRSTRAFTTSQRLSRKKVVVPAVPAEQLKPRLLSLMRNLGLSEPARVAARARTSNTAQGAVEWYRLPGSNGGPLDPQYYEIPVLRLSLNFIAVHHCTENQRFSVS